MYCGPEETSISGSEAVSDCDDEHYETAGPQLAVRPVVQQKVRHKQPMAQGGHPPGAPSVTEFTTYQPYILRQSWSTWVSIFSKCKKKPWQLGFCDSGTQGWAPNLWSVCGSLLREVEE